MSLYTIGQLATIVILNLAFNFSLTSKTWWMQEESVEEPDWIFIFTPKLAVGGKGIKESVCWKVMKTREVTGPQIIQRHLKSHTVQRRGDQISRILLWKLINDKSNVSIELNCTHFRSCFHWQIQAEVINFSSFLSKPYRKALCSWKKNIRTLLNIYQNKRKWKNLGHMLNIF